MIKKIAITGPESTGKSALAEKLALHYHTVFVPEFARSYLSGMGTDYDIEDVINIAKGQMESELHWMDAANDFLFCDTDLINIKIWLEHKFDHCPDWIQEQIAKNHYDLYLLTDIDLPWKDDPLRENPDKSSFFFNKFKEELENINANYRLVSGQGKKRVQNAIQLIDAYQLIANPPDHPINK